ncbi:MAG: hypothetical protein KatS3mg084_0171 [Candidatus Dojkabacteria bacterium]|nr:MAG: hypothetical protein KatS3mg084_0171 [Candidatus Dojkabacteria bacterium]
MSNILYGRGTEKDLRLCSILCVRSNLYYEIFYYVYSRIGDFYYAQEMISKVFLIDDSKNGVF